MVMIILMIIMIIGIIEPWPRSSVANQLNLVSSAREVCQENIILFIMIIIFIIVIFVIVIIISTRVFCRRALSLEMEKGAKHEAMN